MTEQWQRLAEAQRINQEIEAEFQLALSHIGREAADRIREASRGSTDPADRLQRDPRRPTAETRSSR